MPRVFFALWPDGPATAALRPLAKRVAAGVRGRPVPAANLHLTLVFLGDVPDERVEAARRCASGIRGVPFDLVLDRIGSFRHAGVAWAGPSMPKPELVHLQASLDGALRAAGFALDDRPFAPHLTLARKGIHPVVDTAIAPVAWRVDRFVLVRSARDKGAYAELAGWELGTGN